MAIKSAFSLLIIAFILLSCEKEATDIVIIEGKLRDEVSGQALPGINISVDGVKSPSGMGIISDGKRKTVGRGVTDANGYYKIKLKVFEEAERLEISLNSDFSNEGYVSREEQVHLSKVNKHGSNNLNYILSPAALLKISFKNESPHSDEDYIDVGWYHNGYGGTKGVIQQENCGTVAPVYGTVWKGKDACAVITVMAFAEQHTNVYWTVGKNGISKQYNVPVLVKRGVVNEFNISY